MKTLPQPLSLQEFDELFESVCNWGVWGDQDERGTLNYITQESVKAAARLVRSGRSISMAIPINKVAEPDNPRPPAHYMAMVFDGDASAGEPRFCLDFFGSEIHGDCHTHIDALCHVSYKGRLYNGRAATDITARGPRFQDITAYGDGIIGRGVLLDLPRFRGLEWLEPGEAVTAQELEKCEASQGVHLRQGDILVLRTGHHRRRKKKGAWHTGYDGEGRAGLHPTAMRLLRARQVAAFFPDGDGECVPSNVEGVAYPVHALQIVSMGMACADSLQLEDVSKVCASAGRWDFMVVAAPLRLPGGTGSFFNPIAIF